MSIVNADRVAAAAAAIETYALTKQGRNNYEEPPTMASDMMTDVFHYFNNEGESIIAMIRRSLAHVIEEIREEDPDAAQLEDLEALYDLMVVVIRALHGEGRAE